MSRGELAGTLVSAAVVLAASPYLARLSVSVPDREMSDWWRGRAAGTRRLGGTALLAVVLGALAGRAVGWTSVLPAFVALALVSVPLAVIDFEEHRLPNRLVFAGAIAAVVLLLVAAGASDQWHQALRALESAAVVFVLFYSVALFAQFGLGDVKLGALLAAYLGWLGWGYVLYGLLAGFVISALASLPLLVTRRATMKTPVPLGPALIFGALIVAAFQLVPSALA